MPLHYQSPINSLDVRVQAFDALLQEIRGKAGAFQSEHAVLSEDFMGYRLRLGNRHLGLSYRPARDSCLLATLQGPEGTQRSCLGPGSWTALRQRIEATADLMHGHEVEQDLTLAAAEPVLTDGTVVLQDRWWNRWQERPTADGSLGDHYRRVLRPLVRSLVWDRLVEELPEGPRVVDLGGGHGELLDTLELGGHMVERNARQLEAAATGFDREWEIHAGDIRQVPDWAGVAGGPVHLAVSLGSLHLHTMEPTEAWRVAHTLFADLAPGGFLVAAGHTPFLLNRDDLELIGFQVLNTTLPGRDPKGQRQQLYLARRPV